MVKGMILNTSNSTHYKKRQKEKKRIEWDTDWLRNFNNIDLIQTSIIKKLTTKKELRNDSARETIRRSCRMLYASSLASNVHDYQIVGMVISELKLISTCQFINDLCPTSHSLLPLYHVFCPELSISYIHMP